MDDGGIGMIQDGLLGQISLSPPTRPLMDLQNHIENNIGCLFVLYYVNKSLIGQIKIHRAKPCAEVAASVQLGLRSQ